MSSAALKTLLENLPPEDALRMTEKLTEASAAVQAKYGRAANVDELLSLSAMKAFSLGDSSLTMADLVAEAGIKIQSLSAPENAAPEEVAKTDLSKFNPALRLALARKEGRAGDAKAESKHEFSVDPRVIEKLSPADRLSLIRGHDTSAAIKLAKMRIAEEDAALQ